VLLEDHAPAALPRRVLVVTDAFGLADATVSGALEARLDELRSTIGESGTIALGRERMTAWRNDFRILQGAEIWANHGDWVTRTAPEFGPGIRERFAMAATISAEDVRAAQGRRLALAQELAELLEDGTVLCQPTAPGVAPVLDTPPAELEVFRGRALSLLCPAGLAGLPQLNIPAGEIDGAPVGLSVVGVRGADLSIMALARVLPRGG
jgi:amidase